MSTSTGKKTLIGWLHKPLRTVVTRINKTKGICSQILIVSTALRMMNDHKTFVVTKKLDGYQKGKCFRSFYLLLKTVVKLFHDTHSALYNEKISSIAYVSDQFKTFNEVTF